jgi:hypothetical protein
MAVELALGPLTLVCDLLRMPTRMPPTIPASKPENSGAVEAKATPMQSGRATRKTTNPAARSRERVDTEINFEPVTLSSADLPPILTKTLY